MNERQDANPDESDARKTDEGGSLWRDGETPTASKGDDDRSGVLFDRILHEGEKSADELVELQALDQPAEEANEAERDQSALADAAAVDAAMVAIAAEPHAPTEAKPKVAHDDLPTLVRLDNVHKSFGKLSVLRGVTLDIKRGQTTVVIGPSGTGKSVLLKHIVGLLQPDSGDVLFDGKSVPSMDAAQLVELRTRIGFLFQMGALFDSMDVNGNVCFPLMEHTKLSRKEQRLRCDRVLRIVGLAGIGDKMPADLSGGQKKRVALARAIVMEPELVLYDEPTTGLDPIRGDVIDELIIELSRELGITSVVVTHDMSSARKIADRLVMLYDGQIIADGDPDSFYASENDLVQRFIHGKADQEDLDLIRAGFSGESQSK